MSTNSKVVILQISLGGTAAKPGNWANWAGVRFAVGVGVVPDTDSMAAILATAAAANTSMPPDIGSEKVGSTPGGGPLGPGEGMGG